MAKIDSNGNYINDSNTMTTIDKNGNLVRIPMSGKNVTTTKKKKKNEWINTSAFDDGYQPFDVLRTISGTGADIYQDLTKGAFGIGEGIADFLVNTASGGAEAIGQKDVANKMREFAQKDLLEDLGVYDSLTTMNGFGITNAILNGNVEALNPFDKEAKKQNIENIETGSVLGEKADNITQGVGQLVGQAALGGVGVPWQLTAFTQSAGNEMNNAFKNNATYGQALMSGIISGVVEVGSEYIGGGANKLLGMTSLGSKAIEKLGSKISNKLVARLTKLGFDMASEGLEEVISGYGQAIGQKLTYMSDKEINELYSSEEALEEFISGALVSGIANVPGNIQSARRGENAWSGRTENEQKVYDSVLQERINEQQKDGKKLTNKEINAIEEQLQKDMSKGRVSVSQIESALGLGERVNNLIHDAEVRKGQKLTQEEIDAIQNEENEKYLNDISKDTMLQNSYYENSQRSKGFDFDAKKYKGKQLEIVQKAKDSGILNNTGATHEFVDFISKIAADKNVNFDFTNNEKLKNSSFAIDGADVNGFVTNDGITLNIDSKKSLNSVVGHEITHILEGSDVYDALQDSLKEYVGENKWNEKLAKLEELYSKAREQGNNVDTTKELTADLIGDYLFTDEDFINHLTQDRNLFEKIYDEIKYLVKQVTTGSKEERELNKIKKLFEKAYNQNIKNNAEKTNTNYSLAYLDKANLNEKQFNRFKEAYQMKTNNETDEEIWNKTGVIIGDSLANSRIYIPDLDFKDLNLVRSKLKIGSEIELGDIMEGKLFDAYPDLKKVKLGVYDFEKEAIKDNLSPEDIKNYKGTKGAVTESGDIMLNTNVTTLDEALGVLSHEIQHILQHYSGNISNSLEVLKNKGIKEYKLLPYELEAEVNRVMSKMSSNQRRNINPQSIRDEILKYYENNNYGQLDIDKVINNLEMKHGLFGMRYSLSPSGDMVDNTTGEKVELDASDTGNTGTLMALHNLTEDKLNGVLDLGGFPVPSIAITSADKTGQLRYGNITVLFDKNTINPQVKENEVYSSDIYSSRFPALENKINDNVINDLVKKSNYELSYQELKMLAEENRFNADRVPEDLMKVFFNDKGIEWNEQNRNYYENNDDGYNEYSKWVNDLSNQIIGEKRVVKPDVDYYTPSGNIRSIEQRTLPYTLENVVKIMTKKSTKGSEGNGWTGTGEIRGNLSPALKSIEEIKQNENKLITTEEMEQYKNKIEDDFSKITDKLGQYYKYKDTNSYYVLDTVADSINETAKAKKVNVETLKSKLADNFIEGVPDEVLNETIDFLNSLKNAPTEYFEAKPQRAVGLDEIQQVVIPSNASQELRDRLQEMGIPFIEYNPEVEGDRQRVINQFDDLKFSLSQQGEIAPTGNYNVYGKDIALQEQIAPVKEDLSRLNTEIAAIREDYNRQTDELKKQLDELINLRENLFTENEINNNVFPVETEQAIETPSYQENVAELDDKGLKKYKDYFKEVFEVKGRQLTDAMNGIKELSKNPNLTKKDVYNYLKENFGQEETRIKNYEISEAKNELRSTPIGVSPEVKKDIAFRYDTYGNFRKKNFGKLKLVDYNGMNGIDSKYQELSRDYPSLFPDDIINPADQLVQISEIANSKDYDSYYKDIPEADIKAYGDELYGMIQEYRQDTTQTLAEEQLPQNYYDNLVPYEEENNTNVLEDEIARIQQEINGIANRQNLDILNVKNRYDTITNEEDIAQIEKDTANILDLIYQQEQRRNGNVEIAKPVIAKEKSSLRRGIDTLKTMFSNKNDEIDNLAKETGNKNIKFAGDMLNNYVAEAQNDIQVAQTNNEGKAVGKALNQLFEPAKQKGLETILNDYLINYSNIDRWNNNKGSKTPLDVSERIVADYEAKYPELMKWAKDIWQYGKNYLTNMHDAGLINDYIYNYLGEKYQHYVPYITDSNTFDATIDELSELKARGIKKAVGGATELTPIEDALTRYTFAHKRALRTNELYKEIVNQLYTDTDKTNPPAQDRLEDYTNLDNNLYRDDTGNNYLTAFINGEEKSVKISDDLFKSLRNDMETRIKDYEKRLSIITKPLQTIGKARRNILTSLSPSFMITNPVKDIQDAVLNSKHTKQMMKNYLPAIKELWSDSTPEVRQFKALYGSGNTMGQYDAESGLYNPKKGNKNNNFLKRLVKVNEVMELAPRFAEFKASLQAGESYQEAMYNAREITTNFSRGGVITKALNRNGFTFLNANVQGLSKFIRNFSGENGAKGVANSLVKAVIFGVAPAVFNELAFGGLGDDKDEDYDALPDYIKDNYYLIKTGDGNFVRIPKGRMLSVFGSAARRTIELAEGEEDAFEGYLKNANNQVGISSPEESNIFAPLLQAFGSENGENWYGGDLVPSRLQDKPAEEQYDASTDKMSIWLGEKLGVSPYKINYVLDQYSGGIGDIVLPMITDEAQSEGGLLAPVIDKFTADSTTDNKYVSDFYTKNDELKVQSNSSKATDLDKVKNQYMYNVSSEMAKLYAERRKVQSNNSLSKAEKYKKSQSIKDEINKLAKQGLETYESAKITGNYASVGNEEFYKNAKGKWTTIDDDTKEEINSLGLTNLEKNSYFNAKNDIYTTTQEYKDKLENATESQKATLNANKKKSIINTIKNSGLTDEAKANLYDKSYASTDTLNAILDIGINFDSYLDLEAQNFTADKDANGKSINGSKKAKVYNYINNMNMSYNDKIMLAKLYYKTDNTYNQEIINSLNSNPSIDYQEMKQILKAMGMNIDDYGNITW